MTQASLEGGTCLALCLAGMKNYFTHKRTNNSRGFSFTEILITLVILMIGALGTSMLTINNMRTNSSNSLRTKASSAIQDKIENLRLSIRAGQAITSGEDMVDNISRKWTVYNDQPSVGLKTVVVEIKWSQAPMKDSRYLKYASILGSD